MKLIETQNKFSVLRNQEQMDDDNWRRRTEVEDGQSSQSDKQKHCNCEQSRHVKAPLVFVDKATIKKANNLDEMSIETSDLALCAKIKQVLASNDIIFYTHTRKEEKNKIMILKEVSGDFSADEIEEEI